MAAVDERFLTVPEVAEVLRVKPQTVRVWVFTGKLRSEKAGSRVLIPAPAVDEFLGRRQTREARP